jgi:hypothetical protein
MGSFATIAQTRRAAQAAAARAVPRTADPVSYRPTAAFFIQLRQFLGLSVDQAAAHLQTSPEVIAALETGTLSRLPPWPQTYKIVWAYASMAGFDPTPALDSLHFHILQVAADEPALERDPVPAAPAFAVRELLTYWMPRRWPVWRLISAGFVLMVAGLGTQSSSLEAAMTKLPAPLGAMVRYAKETLLFKTSRTFEGMTWIDVENPRTRRADKLPAKRR